MHKKLIALLLTLTIIFGFCFVVSAETSTARLYSVYADNMLFAQNKDAVFAGEGATPGNTIKVQLLNENAWPIMSSTSKVASDGTFEVSFIAPAGSYREYIISLSSPLRSSLVFTIKPKRKIRIIKDNWKVGRVDEGKNPNPAARRCFYIYHTPQVRILHLPHIFKTPRRSNEIEISGTQKRQGGNPQTIHSRTRGD